MSDGDNEESWDDWTPNLEDAEVEGFKWGWNAGEGEVVWTVSGPGDGLPAHAEQLKSEWGRDPSLAAGDVLGAAEYAPSRASAAAVIVIHAYYGEPVPPSSSIGSGVRSRTLNCASQVESERRQTGPSVG